LDNEVVAEAGYHTNYYEANGNYNLGSHVGQEDDDVTRRRSRFSMFDPDYALSVFTMSMVFDNIRRFRMLS